MTDEDNNMLSFSSQWLFVDNAAAVDNNLVDETDTGSTAVRQSPVTHPSPTSRQYLFFFGGRPADRYDPFRATPCVTCRPRDTIGRPDRTVACK